MSADDSPAPPAGNHADTTSADDTGPPVSRMAAVLAVVIVAIVALLASPWSGGMMFAYFGIVPGLLALRISWRATLLGAFATAAAVFVGVWVSGSVPLSVLWMTALAAGIGASARVGWASVGAMIGAQSAIVVVSGKVYAAAPAPFDTPHTAAGALPVAAFALGGGLVMTVATVVFLRGFERPAEPRLDVDDTRWYTATMIVLVLVGTWVCRGAFPGTHSWWFLLTVFVVLLPLPDEASHRMHDRAIGTAIGAVGLMALTALVGVDPTVHRVLAIVGVIGVIATTSRSAIANAAFLTVTVLAMASPGAGNALLLQGERIGLTLAGVLLTWATLMVLHRLRDHLERAPVGRGR